MKNKKLIRYKNYIDRYYLEVLDRKSIELIVGKHYIVNLGKKNFEICKFIQTTKHGFNFLNLDTNKCFLKRHIYQNKFDRSGKTNIFYINKFLQINTSK